MRLDKALERFYVEWGQKIDIVIDKSQPLKSRLAALHWIDRQTGDGLTPAAKLESVADDMREESGGR